MAGVLMAAGHVVAAGNVVTAGYNAHKMADRVLNANRSVWLSLLNSTKDQLWFPSWYGTKGRIHGAMPYCIKPTEDTSCFDFRKTYWGIRGAEGVLKYQIGDTNKSLCIFYSNPYFGHNKFFLGFSDEEDNKKLCKEMLQAAWNSSGQVTWHNSDEKSSDSKYGKYSDKFFKANGYCSQGESAIIFVMLSKK